jgi:hypothetical protein
MRWTRGSSCVSADTKSIVRRSTPVDNQEVKVEGRQAPLLGQDKGNDLGNRLPFVKGRDDDDSPLRLHRPPRALETLPYSTLLRMERGSMCSCYNADENNVDRNLDLERRRGIDRARPGMHNLSSFRGDEHD